MIRIGILGAAEIAHRMFLPALLENNLFHYVGVASHSKDRRIAFKENFGGDYFESYDDIINNKNIDAVYIPLPPALHFEWAKKALQNNKHVLVEKPSTICLEQSKELVELAKYNKLVLQENYMFQYHTQLEYILKMIEEDEIGDIRLVRASFGFPLRERNDFRYNKGLGGGALLDAGGYVVKLGSILLGDTANIKTASSGYIQGYDVDMYGSVTMNNKAGVVYQGAYSLDCHYQCSLEIWGNKGRIYTNRIFTAPPSYSPIITLENSKGKIEIELEADNHFSNSIKAFNEAINNDTQRKKMYRSLLLQSKLVQTIMDIVEENRDDKIY